MFKENLNSEHDNVLGYMNAELDGRFKMVKCF